MRLKRKSRRAQQGPVKAIRWTGKTAVIDVSGDIDMTSSPAFQDSLMDVLAEGPARVVVNLADVPFMDSSGVATLVKVYRKARSTGASMALAALGERVRGIFEVTKLDSFFETHQTVKEAMA